MALLYTSELEIGHSNAGILDFNNHFGLGVSSIRSYEYFSYSYAAYQITA